jgi:hypothetical protein
MKYSKNVLCFLPFIALLTACDVDLTTDIFVTDLFKIEKVKTPALMKIEISSCDSDSRDKLERQLVNMFDVGSDPQLQGCAREGMDSMLIVSFKAQVVRRGQPLIGDIFLVTELDPDNPDRVWLSPVLSKQFLSRMDAVMSDNSQNLGPDDLKVTLVLNNDDASQVSVFGGPAWVDGEAKYLFEEYLERRGKMSVTLSNVASDLLLNQEPELWVLRVTR